MMMNVDLRELATTSVVSILVPMHVVKAHSVEQEIMEPYVLVRVALLATQQPPAVLTEIVVLINVQAVSVTDVLAEGLLGFQDTEDSLMRFSRHSSNRQILCANILSHIRSENMMFRRIRFREYKLFLTAQFYVANN